MGGSGSGTWCRWDKKTTVEDCKKIDVRWMRRHGCLIPGRVGSLHWSSYGESRGEIGYRYSAGMLTLDYRHRQGEHEWVNVAQSIAVSTTPCHFGGSRSWFHCERCERRCAVIYLGSSLFLCRNCHSLPYESQTIGAIERLIHKKHKLGRRIYEIYEGGTGWKRKKGMHSTTFDVLQRRYFDLDERISYAIGAMSGLWCD